MITPNSWKTDPAVFKKPPAKQSSIETAKKSVKTTELSKPIIEQSPIHQKQRTETKQKRKRDTSLFSFINTEVMRL